MAWAAIAAAGVLIVVGLVQFAERMISLPARLAAEQAASLEALQPAQGDPRRDVSLSEALCFAVKGQWGLRPLNAEAGVFIDIGVASMRFQQLAADGELVTWGRRDPNEVFVPIHAEYWRDHQPEWFSLMRGENRTERTNLNASTESYWDVMVNRGQIVRAFAPNRGQA